MEGILGVLVLLIDVLVIFIPPLVLLVGLVVDLVLLFSDELRRFAAIVLGLNVALAATWLLLLAPAFIDTAPIVDFGDGTLQGAVIFGLVALLYIVNIGSWILFWRRSLKPEPRLPVGDW